MDAKNAETRSLNGAEPQETVSPESLLQAVNLLVGHLEAMTNVVSALVQQNSQLLEVLLLTKDEDDPPDTDMAGRPIT